MDACKLNLFFGMPPNEGFVNDLKCLKNLKNDQIIELINKLIGFYSINDKYIANEENNKWIKSFDEDDKTSKMGAIKVLQFIIREFAQKNITEDELINDFKALDLPIEYLEFIQKNSFNIIEKNFNTLPYENNIIKIDWRIDKRFYTNNTNNTVAVIEVLYSNKGEKDFINFDLNKHALHHFINVLKNIEESLNKYE